MKRIIIALIALAACSFSLAAQSVEVKKDPKGWRLLVDSKPLEVKGVVWSCTPIGETHTYNLWNQSDEVIMQMLDTDMPMLKAMGVNTIRAFSTIPPRWVEYIYTKYGIYTMINDLLGRYGVSVNGKWYAQTDYSDRHTRAALVEQAKKTAESYRGVKGVLMYMFGNESNYGLVWSGSNIENLPTGEQNGVKAGYLYSLLEEAMAACKAIDPAHPVGIINGDIQYIELIKQLCPSLDVLGVNAYRGFRFYDSFYESVNDALDKPIVLTESGADAYNALLQQEDQYSQAVYLESQWKEIYENAYGKEKTGNVLGGYVFEWMDEWWKHYQNKNLEVHDTVGTWANAGYELDYRVGVNNMNEEWFGIVAQSTLTEKGIHKRIPRAAYYLLSDIWKLPLYDSSVSDVAARFSSVDPGNYLARGNETSVKEAAAESKLISIDHMSLDVGALAGLDQKKILDKMKAKENWKQEVDTTSWSELSVDLAAKPMENLSATAEVRVWTAPRLTKFDDPYPYYKWDEDAGATYDGDTISAQNVDLYSASMNYTSDNFDLNGYYHVGHGSYELSGDMFGITREAWDIIGADTDGNTGPFALEYIGKGLFSGLQVIGGSEVWAGSKPQIIMNYYRTFPSSSVWMPEFTAGMVFAEEFGDSAVATEDAYNTYGPGRKFSLSGTAHLYPFATLKLGFLHAGDEKVNALYYLKDGTEKEVTFADTLGANVELGTEIFRYTYLYSRFIYRGLVAQTQGETVRGDFFTADSGAGNRQEIQLGADFNYGSFNIKSVLRARVPLVGPAGRSLTATYPAPFIVKANRQAIEAEAVATWDPEGATWFHDWNSKDVEGAKLAGCLAGLYTLYAGPTDLIPYKLADGTWSSFTVALPERRNLWQLAAKLITSPLPDLKVIGGANVGHEDGIGSGAASRIVDYWGLSSEVRYKRLMAKTSFTVDSWGPESWYREFNQTFPLQWNVDLAYGFGVPSFVTATNRVGIRWQGWTYGAYSSDPYGALSTTDIDGRSYSEISVYCNISF